MLIKGLKVVKCQLWVFASYVEFLNFMVLTFLGNIPGIVYAVYVIVFVKSTSMNTDTHFILVFWVVDLILTHNLLNGSDAFPILLLGLSTLNLVLYLLMSSELLVSYPLFNSCVLLNVISTIYYLFQILCF